MTPDDKTATAELMKASIDWSRYPKLAATFQHRPGVNVYWHELVDLIRELAPARAEKEPTE